MLCASFEKNFRGALQDVHMMASGYAIAECLQGVLEFILRFAMNLLQLIKARIVAIAAYVAKTIQVVVDYVKESIADTVATAKKVTVGVASIMYRMTGAETIVKFMKPKLVQVVCFVVEKMSSAVEYLALAISEAFTAIRTAVWCSSKCNDSMQYQPLSIMLLLQYLAETVVRIAMYAVARTHDAYERMMESIVETRTILLLALYEWGVFPGHEQAEQKPFATDGETNMDEGKNAMNQLVCVKQKRPVLELNKPTFQWLLRSLLNPPKIDWIEKCKFGPDAVVHWKVDIGKKTMTCVVEQQGKPPRRVHEFSGVSILA